MLHLNKFADGPPPRFQYSKVAGEFLVSIECVWEEKIKNAEAVTFFIFSPV